MNNYAANPLIFIISTLLHMYAFAFALRFVFQWVRADFYNPVSQFIVKITSPLVNPVRRLLPSVKGLDTSTLLLCYLILVISQIIVQSLSGYQITVKSVTLLSITDLVSMILDVFFFGILIQVIISWVNPQSLNPVNSLLHSVTAPVLRPVQKFIPPIGGMDISPIFAMIGLKVIEMLINPIFYAFLK